MIFNMDVRKQASLQCLYFILFTLTLLSVGCAVLVPVHETSPPQTLGQYSLKLASEGGGAPAVGPDLKSEGIDYSNIEADSDVAIGANISLGLFKQIDLELSEMVSFASGATSALSLKYQFLGEPLTDKKADEWVASIKLSLISGSGYEDDPNDSSDQIFSGLYVEKMQLFGAGVTFLFGRATATWATLYGGLKYLNLNLDSKYREGSSTGTFHQGDRDFDIYAALLGAYLHWGGTIGQHFYIGYAIGLELEQAQVPKTFENGTTGFSGSMISSSFIFRWK